MGVIRLERGVEALAHLLTGCHGRGNRRGNVDQALDAIRFVVDNEDVQWVHFWKLCPTGEMNQGVRVDNSQHIANGPRTDQGINPTHRRMTLPPEAPRHKLSRDENQRKRGKRETRKTNQARNSTRENRRR
jgi:hypothetical protein